MSTPEVAAAQARIAALQGPTPPAAARALLNALVGSRTSKALHARQGAADALTRLLPCAPAAAALGSLAVNCETGARAVSDARAAPALVAALFEADAVSVQAGARALRALLASEAGAEGARVALLEEGRRGAERVVELMGDRTVGLVETAAGIVGGLCEHEGAVGVLEGVGVVPALVEVLKGAGGHTPSTEAALAALAALVAGDAALGRELVEGHGIVACALRALRGRGEMLRMRAARLLTNVHCAARGAVDAHAAAHAEESVYCGPAFVTSGGDMDETIMTGVDPGGALGGQCAALPRRALWTLVNELVRLMDEEVPHAVRVDAPRVLAKLVEGSPRLQEVACEAGVVNRLKGYLDLGIPGKLELLVARPLAAGGFARMESGSSATRDVEEDVNAALTDAGRGIYSLQTTGGTKMRKTGDLSELMPICPETGPECDLVVSAFECLAAVCALHEKGREACIVAHVIPPIVLGLQHGSMDVVLAAVKCVRSLSRSVKVVRRELVYVNIAVPLLRLLKLESLEVKRQASACICNVAVEFSPLQETVLRDGGVPVLVGLVRSSDTLLRLNSLWALQNMMYRAKPETRGALMENLGYHELVVLCKDPNTGIRTRAVMLLRNLVCAVVHDPGKGEVSDLGALLKKLGEDNLFEALADALDPKSPIGVVFHAIYVISNIASGPEWCKVQVLNSSLAGLLLRWTEHHDEQVRVAVLYCVINLAWHQSLEIGKSGERAGRELSSDIVKRRSRIRRRGWLVAIPTENDADMDIDSLERGASPDSGEDAELTIGDQVDAMEEAMQDDDVEEESEGEGNEMADVDVGSDGAGPGAEISSGNSADGKPGVPDDSGPAVDGISDRVPDLHLAGEVNSSCHNWRIQRLCDLGFKRRCLEIVEGRGTNHVDVVGRAQKCLNIMRGSCVRTQPRASTC